MCLADFIDNQFRGFVVLLTSWVRNFTCAWLIPFLPMVTDAFPSQWIVHRGVLRRLQMRRFPAPCRACYPPSASVEDPGRRKVMAPHGYPSSIWIIGGGPSGEGQNQPSSCSQPCFRTTSAKYHHTCTGTGHPAHAWRWSLEVGSPVWGTLLIRWSCFASRYMR